MGNKTRKHNNTYNPLRASRSLGAKGKSLQSTIFDTGGQFPAEMSATYHSRTVLRNLKKEEKIEFNLGQPISGWIPVYFKSRDFILEFTSSKIPENPTDKLCEALILIANKVESEMCWTEQPVCYFFKFVPADNSYSFSIDETDKHGQNRTEIFHKNGGFDDLVMPIYRGLKKWTTVEYKTSDWKQIEQNKLDKLTNLIKAKQNLLKDFK